MPTNANLPGADGAHINTADKAAFDVATLDLGIDLAMVDWTVAANLITRWGSANNLAWILNMNGAGIVAFSYTSDGVNAVTNVSTAAVPFTANQRGWVRASFDPAVQLIFYTSTNGVAWTQLGAAIPLTSSLFAASNSPIDIGRNNFSAGLGNYLNAKVYRAYISTVPGVPLASPDFRNMPLNATSVVDAQGNTWALNGTASVQVAAGGGLFRRGRPLELPLRRAA